MADASAVDNGRVGDVKGGEYADTLSLMLQRWTYATDQWRDTRDEGNVDMRYISGDPWDPGDRKAREDARRPVITFDELGQYVNQLINEVRQHKRAIKVTPVGYGANDKKAEFRANLIRQIEYRSNAQQAYTTMFENTVQRSYGFLRVKSRYVQEPSTSGGKGGGFDQELVIQELPNPNLVTVDPDIQRRDGSDMQFAWIAESWSLRDYKKRFPKARIQDFDSETAKTIPGSWVYNQDRIQLAEYFAIEHERRELLLFKNFVDPQTGQPRAVEVFKDDLKQPEWASLAKLEPDDSRWVETPVVRKYLTNGFEVLEKPTIWPGTTIPIVCCFGKVLYVDDGGKASRKILSLIRLARDPMMLLCYYRTAEAEQVGMSTKFPYFIRKGSLSNDQAQLLQQSLHEPVAFIEVNATSDQLPPGKVPEMPVRNPFEPAIQALEVGAEACRRAIQAAMGGAPLPTQAQRKNEKSGVALQEIRNAEQQGSFHFIDNYEMSITRAGAIVEEVLDTYYDTARDVTVRTPGDQTKVVRINDQTNLAEGQEEPIEVGGGEFDVTLSTGPDFASEREASNAFADTLLSTPFASLVADLAVKLKNLGPIGDEISERLFAMLPAPIQALSKGKTAQTAQLVQQVQQASQMVEQLSKELNVRVQQIQTEEVKAKRDIEIEKLKNEFEIQRLKIEAVLKGHVEAQKIDVDLKKIDADLLKTRATLEVQQTEAMIDAAVRQDNAAIAAAGERESRQVAVSEADKDRRFQAASDQIGRESEAEQAERDRQMASESAQAE